MVSGQLALHKYATGRQARVITAMTLFKQHLFKWVTGSPEGHTHHCLSCGLDVVQVQSNACWRSLPYAALPLDPHLTTLAGSRRRWSDDCGGQQVQVVGVPG